MKIYIQKNAIKYETDKAILVKIPRQKFKVWLPKSLVKDTLWFYTVFLPEDMTFTLIFNNHDKKYCSAESLSKLFEGQELRIIHKEKVEHHIPKEIKNIQKVEVDDSLKR